jgi:hypothetical protein
LFARLREFYKKKQWKTWQEIRPGRAKRAGGRIPHSSCIKRERVPDSAPAIQISVCGHVDKKKSGAARFSQLRCNFAGVRSRSPPCPEIAGIADVDPKRSQSCQKMVGIGRQSNLMGVVGALPDECCSD